MSARRGRHPEQVLFAFAEERDARRRGLDELFAALGAFRAGGRFLRLLACMGRFRDYGPYNALLAAVQRPEAVCILPPSKWRAYNREVKPAARPIVLLRPFSPVTCVFDLADTRVIRGRVWTVFRRKPPRRRGRSIWRTVPRKRLRCPCGRAGSCRGVPEEASVDAVLDAVAQVEALLGDACMVRDGFLARYAPAFAARLRADGKGDDILDGSFKQETTAT